MTPPPPTSTRFPYTTLFRSCRRGVGSGRRRGEGETPPAGRARAGTWRRGRRGRSPSSSARSDGPDGSRVSARRGRSEEHTSELQSLRHLVCRLLLEKKNKIR